MIECDRQRIYIELIRSCLLLESIIDFERTAHIDFAHKNFELLLLTEITIIISNK